MRFVADAGRVEDVQHRGPVVLVLHRLGRGGILEAQRQHLLARQRGALREPVHRVRGGLGGEGRPYGAQKETNSQITRAVL